MNENGFKIRVCHADHDFVRTFHLFPPTRAGVDRVELMRQAHSACETVVDKREERHGCRSSAVSSHLAGCQLLPTTWVRTWPQPSCLSYEYVRECVCAVCTCVLRKAPLARSGAKSKWQKISAGEFQTAFEPRLWFRRCDDFIRLNGPRPDTHIILSEPCQLLLLTRSTHLQRP